MMTARDLHHTRHVVLYSIASGRARRSDDRAKIREFFKERKIPYVLVDFDRRKDKLENLDWAELLGSGPARIVVVGGDGMLRGVAEFVYQRKLPVAIGYLPRGSANVFAVVQGVPRRLHDALEALLTRPERMLPVGVFNGRHVFLLGACFGRFAEYTLHADSRLKRSVGYVAYGIAAIQRIWWFPRQPMTITTPEARHAVHAHSLLVCTPAVAGTLFPRRSEKTHGLHGIAFMNYSLGGLIHGMAELYAARSPSPRSLQIAGKTVHVEGAFHDRLHLDGDTVALAPNETLCTLEFVDDAVRFIG